MSRDKIIEKVLNDVSVDSRITDGIFNIQNNQHVGYLCEYLISKGLDSDLVFEFAGTLLEKGNFPERQAYNVKGILVTFPTPEYKKEAIRAGTHFETDPTRGHPNVFSGETPPATEPPASATAGQAAPTKTNLPVSTSTATPSPAEKSGEETSEPAQQMPNAFTTAAPQQSPEQPETKDEPTKLPPPQPVPPAEKEANKDAVKKIFKGDDFMLQESLFNRIKNFINPKAITHYEAMVDNWVKSLNPWIFNAAIGKYEDDPMSVILTIMNKGNFENIQRKVSGMASQYLFHYAVMQIIKELKTWIPDWDDQKI